MQSDPQPAQESGEQIVVQQKARQGAATYHLLDGWRGIAAIMVVLYHATQGIILKDPTLLQHPFFKVSSYGMLGVDVFFVVSGYCILAAVASSMKRHEGTASFFAKRVRRIYPTYLIAMILFIVIGKAIIFLVGTGLLPQEARSIPLVANGNISAGILFWVSNVTLTQILLRQGFVVTLAWTLCYEIAFYVIVGTVYFADRKGAGIDFVLSATHGITLLSSLSLLIWGGRVPYPFDMWPWFGIGVAIYDYLVADKSRTTQARLFGRGSVVICLTCALLCAAVLSERLTTLSIWKGEATPQVLTAVVLTLFLLGLRPWDEQLARTSLLRPLIFVGLFSYSLYLTHMLAVHLTRATLHMIGLDSRYEIIKAIIILCVALVLAYIFYLVGEKPFLSKKRVVR